MNLVEELWKLNRKYSPYFTWGAKPSGNLHSAVPHLRARRKEGAKEPKSTKSRKPTNGVKATRAHNNKDNTQRNTLLAHNTTLTRHGHRKAITQPDRQMRNAQPTTN
ncbi:hypothetical protein FVEG_15138 [Fusarium verticillioides 7600]|uniref:Uncharacterized protein n=1 Tax=Gibberella moniliformis (strain M3125 / FGSC 7600) TaxID=334819 RepID=W7LM56_GIBM7|nr:hypothetical protein FVEG_15138 [Fusarium verticillioides 7600]EWG40473.1 hypothetical protein FVEG_15138 [Fusarium verticillioides 7600]